MNAKLARENSAWIISPLLKEIVIVFCFSTLHQLKLGSINDKTLAWYVDGRCSSLVRIVGGQQEVPNRALDGALIFETSVAFPRYLLFRKVRLSSNVNSSKLYGP